MFSHWLEKWCVSPQERAALAAASDPYRYVEKRKPIPDPQVASPHLLSIWDSNKLFHNRSFELFPYANTLCNDQDTGLIYGKKKDPTKSDN